MAGLVEVRGTPRNMNGAGGGTGRGQSPLTSVHVILKVICRRALIEGVDFRGEQAEQGDRSVEQQGRRHYNRLLVDPEGREVGGYEYQPDEQGRVDAESYIARFVEVVWQGPCLEGVVRTYDDQEDVVGQ